MRRKALPALVALAAVVAPGAAQQRDAQPRIAVMPFSNDGSFGSDEQAFDALEVGLAQMLITAIAQNPNAHLIERHELRQIVEGQDPSTRIDSQTATMIGRAVGAQYVILGGFIDFDGDFRIDARIVNAETGEILATARVQDDRAKLYTLVTDIAIRIMEDLDLAPLPAAVEQAHRTRAVPAEALDLYCRALLASDRGDAGRAIELFNRAISVFPGFAEAKRELKRIEKP